jgi:ABC-type uncharacterized transport system substrate-binding protein
MDLKRLFSQSLLIILFLINFNASGNTQKPFKVYVLFSYLPGLWSEEALKGVKQALLYNEFTSHDIRSYDYDYVRKRKNKDQEYSKIKKDISDFNPDLIIVFDDEAAEDFIPRLNSFKIPIIATGINKEVKDLNWYLPEGNRNRYFTGILERYPFEEPLKLLKKLNANITKISILTTDNVSSNIITEQFKNKFLSYGGEYSGIKLADVMASRKWEKWKEYIKGKRSKNEAFWILVPWDVYDESGEEVKINVMGQFYQKESFIPELGIVNASNLLGMLACFSVNSEDLAFEAVNIGIESQRKKKMLRDIPFQKVQSARVIINKKRADQLNIVIPLSFLDFAKIEKKIPLEHKR